MNGLELGSGEGLADLAPGVGEELERTRGGDARVELAQRAGGEVARIGEGRLAGLGLAGVERAKIGVAHIDLSARLEDFGRAGQAVRDGVDGADIGGDVLALVAVAPRRRLDELAVLVAQAAREPVDLRLGDHGERARSRASRESA